MFFMWVLHDPICIEILPSAHQRHMLKLITQVMLMEPKLQLDITFDRASMNDPSVIVNSSLDFINSAAAKAEIIHLNRPGSNAAPLILALHSYHPQSRIHQLAVVLHIYRNIWAQPQFAKYSNGILLGAIVCITNWYDIGTISHLFGVDPVRFSIIVEDVRPLVLHLKNLKPEDTHAGLYIELFSCYFGLESQVALLAHDYLNERVEQASYALPIAEIIPTVKSAISVTFAALKYDRRVDVTSLADFGQFDRNFFCSCCDWIWYNDREFWSRKSGIEPRMRLLWYPSQVKYAQIMSKMCSQLELDPEVPVDTLKRLPMGLLTSKSIEFACAAILRSLGLTIPEVFIETVLVESKQSQTQLSNFARLVGNYK